MALPLLFCFEGGVARADDRLAFFEAKIRPVLVEHCYACHSVEAASVKGGLLLDYRDGWQIGGDSGPAVVAGKPNESLLLAALQYDGLEMPPDKKLPPGVVNDFVTWIRAGAVDPRDKKPARTKSAEQSWEEKFAERRRWWSLQPPRAPEVPEVRNPAGSAHPVDRFIEARLESEQLALNPEADRVTLLRRAYFDLIGLPPPFVEIAAFNADKSPDAWPNAIDRLLARPEYGQRWARHWLDVARYADTMEQSVDGERRIPFAHTFRDYVVDALNADKPFDRFVEEQIAADLLPANEKPDLRALGFLTVGRRFRGNADAPQLIVDDRIDVIGRGFLATTLACARCHDHKFDAVATADYYSLYGIIGSVEEPLDLPEVGCSADPEVRRKHLAERARVLQEYEAHVDHCTAEVNRKLREWAGDYLQYVVRSSPEFRTIEGFVPLDTPRGYLAFGGPERWRRLLEQSREPREPVFRLWHELFDLGREDFTARAETVIAAMLSDPAGYNPVVVAAFRDARPDSMLAAAELYGRVIDDALKQSDSVSLRIVERIYGPTSAVPVSRDETAADLRKFLTDRLFVERFESVQAEQIRFKLLALDIAGPIDRAMAVRASPKPLDARILLRGDARQPGPAVPRRFLRALIDVDDREYSGDGRLELARAIASPKNPLTARVIVNRVWQHHFGRGLVATPDDFGVMGDKPSHPELLDHLALWFVDNGWSLKALHRYLLTTAAWRRSGQPNAHAVERDPTNRLLWRMTPRRLEFEPLRDALLFVAGHLDTKFGGVSQPLDEGNRRRALYGYIDRFRVSAMLRVFDVANPDTSISRRDETIVSQQALFLLNSSFVQAQAEATAEKLWSSGDIKAAAPFEGGALIRAAYRQVLARDPAEEELQLSREFFAGCESEVAIKKRLAGFVQALFMTNEFAYVD